jgi:dihydropyrimidinase
MLHPRRLLLFAVFALFIALNLGGKAQAPQELLIRHASIVNADGRSEGDIRIRGEKIAEIGRNLTPGAGATEIDASGMLVLPGGIDPHVHLSAQLTADMRPGATVDDYTSGSAAAIAGGVTTITNFVSKRPDEPVDGFLKRVTAEVEKSAIADMMLHVMVGNDPSWMTPEVLDTLAKAGFTSTKTFMRVPAFDANVIGFMELFYRSGPAGMLSMIHCEDNAMLTATINKMMAEGRGNLHNYAESRPVATEEAATARAVEIAEVTGSPVYIVHLSAERALRVAEEAQARGLPVYVETRPMYLHLTREVYARPDVGLYIGEPPLRDKSDVEYLWKGIVKGSVHVVATDHSGFTREAKLDPTQTVSNKRAGMNNLQVYRPMLFSEGVKKGRISVQQFVAVTSTNEAKIFGMYPRKGTIQVGSDADIVVWDPNLRHTIRDDDELSNTKYSVFAGTEVTGWPKITIRRGEIVFQNGKMIGHAGTGKLIPQAKWQKTQIVARASK